MASRFLVALGAVLLSACSVGGSAEPEQPQQHPDLTYITDDMVVPETVFPSDTGGQFRFIPVKVTSATEDKADVCTTHYTQEAGARIAGGEPTYIVEIFAVTERVDLNTLIGSCVAADDEEVHSVSEAPAGAVPACAIKEPDGARTECVVMGYTRGVLVSVIVRRSAEPEAQPSVTNRGVAEMLRLYSIQSERIATWNTP